MDNKPTQYIKQVSQSEYLSVYQLLQDVTMNNLPLVQKEFTELTESKEIHNILFDLSAVKKSDTAGVAALVELIHVMKTKHIKGQVGLVGLSKNLESLLLVTKVSSMFKIFSSEKKAKEALSKA